MGKKCLQSIISFAVILGIWQFACMTFSVNEALVPSPLKVAQAFAELLTEGLPGSISRVTLTEHIGISLYRFAVGYLTAVVSAVLLGLLFGSFPKAFAFVNPIVQVLRPIAPVAFLPFIVLWFGIGDLPAIVIIFIAGFFQIFLSTVSAAQNINPIYMKVAKNFGVSRGKTVFGIVFPATFSQIAHSIRIALGTSWIFLVSGEMVGAQSGLGFLIMDTKNCIRFDSLLATMITIGILGFLLDMLMGLLEKKAKDALGLGM
ncbi:MAG: ABC transporter permease [Lachnospiraceae bacterium]|nr:ABC transporter permease [Lachnospiraceae bacterium]